METCTICFEELDEEKSNLCHLNCKHNYHTACIQKWFLLESKTCPQCRQNSLCEHDSNAKEHLQPYLFDIIKEQSQKIANLESRFLPDIWIPSDPPIVDLRDPPWIDIQRISLNEIDEVPEINYPVPNEFPDINIFARFSMNHSISNARSIQDARPSFPRSRS